jgi:tetratricopeptide (TPR) repeat protein
MPGEASERETLVREIFEACVDLPVSDRRILLDRCDPEVRNEVEALLEADYLDKQRLRRLDQPELLPTDSVSEGEFVGRYEILQELGRGGMGVVHLARDTVLGRQLVLKFLSPAVAADDEARGRFAGEAKAASALDHPNICTVYDVGTTEAGSMYIAMAYYEGQTLKSRIAQGPFTIEEVADTALQILSGLGSAHDAGIVHRDVKPANVMMTPRGEAKLLDFGLAKTAGPGLTRTGIVMGTLAYMSPEQVLGKEVDATTDLWSTGVMMYEMLSGQRPFRADYDQAILYAIAHEEPERLEKVAPHVPAGLCEIVHDLLRKDPGSRPGSARAVAQRLAQWSSAPTGAVATKTGRRRRFMTVVLTSAVALSVASALLLWLGGSESVAVQDLMEEAIYYRSLEGPHNTRTAIERLREVVRRDSMNAAAHAKLAEAYVLLDDEVSESLARASLQRAMLLDSTLSEAHVSRGLILELYEWDWRGAEEAFQRAVSLDPLNASAHYELGWLQLRTGRTRQALGNLRRARSVDSGSILTLFGMGVGQYYSGDYGAASTSFQQLMRQAPGHYLAWAFLLMSYLEGGQFVDATSMLNRLADPSAFYRSDLGAYYFAASGVRQSAMEVLREAGDGLSAWQRARVFAALGEFDMAILELQGSMDDPPRAMIGLGIEPAFEPLRSDARFQEMLQRLGLSSGEETVR